MVSQSYARVAPADAVAGPVARWPLFEQRHCPRQYTRKQLPPQVQQEFLMSDLEAGRMVFRSGASHEVAGVPPLLVPLPMREFLPPLVFPGVLVPGSFHGIAWRTLLGSVSPTSCVGGSHGTRVREAKRRARVVRSDIGSRQRQLCEEHLRGAEPETWDRARSGAVRKPLVERLLSDNIRV